jgi:photosystem II stability/assembly factor-like uncharacterized protein
LNADVRSGSPLRRAGAVLVGIGLAFVALSQAAGAPLQHSFSKSRPVVWVSVAAGDPSRVWVETATGGLLSSDGGRTFKVPRPASGFRSAQVAQATLLADGKTLVAMPTLWSAQRFSPPRWSGDGGATWHDGALHGADAHYDFPVKAGFVGEYPVTADPVDARTAWFCQGNLYLTRDAGRTWAAASPRFKRPWHCAALAISPGKAHTMLLLAQSQSKNPRRVPGKLLRSSDGGTTWHSVKAPRFPHLDYNGHALAFDPARPSTALMIGANGTALGALYRSVDAGLHWKRVRPGGKLRGVVVDQFAFAADGSALALARIGGRQSAAFASPDAGGHWSIAPSPRLGSRSPAIYASPLAASGTTFLLGTNRRGFWRLAPGARRWVAP